MWQIALLLLFTLSTINYLRGWRRLRRVLPTLATAKRLLLFFGCTLSMIVGLIYPLPQMTPFWLGHTLQLAAVGILSGWLYWLAGGFHVILWSLPLLQRQLLTRYVIRRSFLNPLLRLSRAPLFIGTLGLVTVLLWYTPAWMRLSQANILVRNLGLLWLLVVSRLVWWVIVGTGPRHRP